MYALYTILYAAALVFLMPFEYLKRRGNVRKRWLRERMGFYEPGAFSHDKSRTLWLHAVSVGEVIAAVPLVKRLRSLYPSLSIIVSTVTDTGQEVASERVGSEAQVIYMPFDLPSAVRRAIAYIRPALFIVMETELWPHLIRMLSNNAVPIVLMNGRISERSFEGYMKMRFFMEEVLKEVTLFCMQDEVYAERIKRMGADPEKVEAIGNLKFDTKPPGPIPGWTKTLNGPVIVAGSTHETEEDLIIDVYRELQTSFPHLNLIVAPRHPERFREVEGILKKKGMAYLKRSELAGSGVQDSGSEKSGLLVILDVMGELASVYGACDVAILGGSFIEHGGQNPLEPAYWGKAIVCGPHMENFPFVEDFYKKGGALEVTRETLCQVLHDLLHSRDRMASLGGVAKALYEKNSGAAGRALHILGRFLQRDRTP